MQRLFVTASFLFLSLFLNANTIIVKNIDELNAANKNAQPGDIIVLQNGEWNNVTIKLTCTGTEKQPITFKAQTAGKVIITGNSQLRLGGTYIVADGLYFINGYAGNDPVINFRVDNKQLANHCRVTNVVVNDFNNPKRMTENNWVLFYGQHNRLDHCSFKDKKNMGVLLAVILDDDRSRENFHSIDHNYFGRRPPLASNGGEMIRVGVSQHCEFNSNTQITNNFFEDCDGETEIISIKSCSNVVKENVFKECQGGVVLRHGNYNTVENNLFLGNGKEGTGGVRIINKGQWVVNNFFYKCRGVDFRSPLSVMNGIPNSPANRYVQVTDAVIANNTFYDCSTASFCEGSDAERTLPPANVLLVNNIFYTNDSVIYRSFDNTSGFAFQSNMITTSVSQPLAPGFQKASLAVQTNLVAPMPFWVSTKTVMLNDSIQQAAQKRLQHTLSGKPGFSDVALLKKLQANATQSTGASWYKQMNKEVALKTITVKCATAEEIYKQLERKEPVLIQLTNTSYKLNKPFLINKSVHFDGDKKKNIVFETVQMRSLFLVAGKGNLTLSNINIRGEKIKVAHLISNDSSGSSDHYKLTVSNCAVRSLYYTNGCQTIFFAYKSMVADNISFTNNTFEDNSCNGIILADEKDDKGYYSVENITVTGNKFIDQYGTLLNIYRGGNDESTMGPNFTFTGNEARNCNIEGALLNLMGVQMSIISSNQFTDCNRSGILLSYKDNVRARHLFANNKINNSGKIEKDQFVTEKGNVSDAL